MAGYGTREAQKVSPSFGWGSFLLCGSAIDLRRSNKTISIEYDRDQLDKVLKLSGSTLPFVLSTHGRLIFEMNFTTGGWSG